MIRFVAFVTLLLAGGAAGAVAQNDAQSQFMMGERYRIGMGVERGHRRSARLR